MAEDNDAIYSDRKNRERAEAIEERRLTRAELLAAETARTKLIIESHERHFERINGHIEKFAEALVALEKHQIDRDAKADARMAATSEANAKSIRNVTVLLSVLMFLAAAGSILVQVLH